MVRNLPKRSIFSRRCRIEALEQRTLLSGGSAAPDLTWFTPAQIKSAYGIGSSLGDGSGQTIAIVDAFDDPNILGDLRQFDLQFGIADPPSFTKIDQYGNTSFSMYADPNWNEEEAMDVEWAHAIAPGASIVLVEAYPVGGYWDMGNLLDAVDYARNLPDVTVVSMSWGEPDFYGENLLDSHFLTPANHQGITFLASAGDNGWPGNWPAYSPNVVAVGGTTLTAPGGVYESETTWWTVEQQYPYAEYSSGGGVSSFEPQPFYQQDLEIHSGSDVINQGGMRAMPDVAFDANPSPGVAVYDSCSPGTSDAPWFSDNGTSLGTPCWAGLVAIADQIRADPDHGFSSLDGPSETLPALYQIYGNQTRYAADFHDITTGSENTYYDAATGYDLCTGIGSPIANNLVPDLASADTPDLTVAVTHSGNFTQGDVGNTYTITVSNVGSGSARGTVSLEDDLPTGLVATGFTGSGWTVDFGTLTATRTDSLAAGDSYPALTLTVDVANYAASTVTNEATVTGTDYNTSNNTGSDQTTILPGGTTFIWTGQGTDDNWTTGGNWQGGITPSAGDRLFFQGTTGTSSVNNFTVGTVFDSISFENGGFSLSGNAVELEPQHGFAIDNAGENNISLPITLGQNSTFLVESGGALSLGTDANGDPAVDTNGYLLTVETASGSASVWGGAVAGLGSLTKAGLGTLTLEGENSYQGPTAVPQGMLVLAGGDNRLFTSTVVTLGDSDGDGGVLQLGDGTDQTIGGLVSANNGGDNRVVGGGADDATLTLDMTSNRSFYGYLGGSGQYEDNLGVVKSGSGMESLYSASTYTGGTEISSGILNVQSDGALGVDGAITLDGGTLRGIDELDNNIVAADSTVSSIWATSSWAALTLNGDITGSGTISCSPYGQLLSLGGTNDAVGSNPGFTGTFIQSGESAFTQFTNANAGSGNATWQIDNGVLASNISNNQAVTINLGALTSGTGESNGVVENEGAQSTVTFVGGGNNQPAEFYGLICDLNNGYVGLTKVGTGTLTLSNAETYTGGTTISAGTLQLGDGTTNGSVMGNITDNAALTFDNASDQTYSGVISGSGTVTKVGASTMLTLSGANTYTGVTTIESGALYITNATAINTILTAALSAGVNNTDGFLMLDYGSGTDPMSTVLSLLAAARSNNFQSGQIYDTSATSKIGLGWVDNTTTDQITVMPALYGDTNLDGTVDNNDLGQVLEAFNKPGNWSWFQGDSTYDGVVNNNDLGNVLMNFNKTGPLDINDIPS